MLNKLIPFQSLFYMFLFCFYACNDSSEKGKGTESKLDDRYLNNTMDTAPSNANLADDIAGKVKLGDNTAQNLSTALTPAEIITKFGRSSLISFNHSICNRYEDNEKNIKMYCWGKNDYSLLAKDSRFSFTPVAAPTLDQAVSLSFNQGFGCFLSDKNTINCWGANDFNQISSDSSKTLFLEPKKIFDPITKNGDKIYSLRNAIFIINSNGELEVTGVGRAIANPNNTSQTRDVFLGLGPIPGETIIKTPQKVLIPGQEKIIAFTSTGFTHFARGSSGKFYCWGSNSFGQCRKQVNGLTWEQMTTNWSTPTESRVPATAKDLQIYSGSFCYIDVQNKLFCFGYDNPYQKIISNGTTLSLSDIDSNSLLQVNKPIEPPLVKGKFTVESLARVAPENVGRICVVTSTKSVKCWGSNNFGALGINMPIELNTSRNFQAAPSDVIDVTGKPLTNVKMVALNSVTSCALKNDSSIWCWGSNSNFRLGTSSVPFDGASNVAVPTEITSGAESIIPLADGFCAFVSKKLMCWGSSPYLGVTLPSWISLLGNSNSKKILEIDYLQSGVKNMEPSVGAKCVTTEANTFRCWGGLISANIEGFNSSIENSSATQPDYFKLARIPFPQPYQLYGSLSNISNVETGGSHACAFFNGEVKCWGNNNLGQLGNGKSEKTGIPTFPMRLPTRIIQVTLGKDFSCFLDSSYKVYCTGDNSRLQLGVLGVSNSLEPVPLNSAIGFRYIKSGTNFVCGINVDFKVFCWGNNANGQMGDGTDSSKATPTEVKNLIEGALTVLPSDTHVCAINTLGVVKCWGDNSQGQLGDETTTNSNVPVLVKGLPSKAVSLSLGIAHTCATTEKDEIYCWGSNEFGQLGINPTTLPRSLKPVLVKARP